MSSDEPSNERARRATVALAILVAALAAFVAPAGAASGQGTAAMVLAEHSKGRTLSGQGVKVLAGAPATKTGRGLSLPISAVDPSAAANATATGSLQFKRGKQSATLTGLHFSLSGDALKGSLDGAQIDVFKLGGKATANASSGAIGIDAGKLRLTAATADALKQKLSLRRALRRDGVGMVWLAAQTNPAHETAKPVTSGSAGWGVLASWRAYVLGEFGPGSVGTMAVGDGATASGPLTSPATVFGFPATGGSFEKGLYGATDKLALKTQGNVVFTKFGHCIIEVKFADLEVSLNGTNSSLTLDSGYDVDTPKGKACEPQPPVANADVNFAKLDLSGIAPAYSADGKTVTWTAIPASLTAVGSVAFLGSKYAVGQALDPVTITVGIG
jgi:hypothetical protein